MNVYSYCIYGLLVSILFSTGCASMQPLSSYARSGDTVTVSLGGTDSNALASIVKKENVTVTITDAAGANYPVKVRNVFRIYGDPSSKYAYRSVLDNEFFEGFVLPHQGQWMAILDLIDPASGQPLPLAVGKATLAVASPSLQPWFDYPGWGWTWTNGNLSSIPIEILAGSGSPNPLNYMAPITTYPLDALEPGPQIEVTAAGTPSQSVGGGTFTFRYAVASFNRQRPRAIVATPDDNVELASQNVDQGDGTALLKVMISNPHGFNVDNQKTDAGGQSVLANGCSLRRSLRFSLVWDASNTAVTDANWQGAISLVDARYIDLYGNAMPELAPVLEKIR